MNHFEAHLMVSQVDSKAFGMAIQFEYIFFLIIGQNFECNFRRFLFGMNPDVPAFEVCVFTSDFKFWIVV